MSSKIYNYAKIITISQIIIDIAIIHPFFVASISLFLYKFLSDLSNSLFVKRTLKAAMTIPGMFTTNVLIPKNIITSIILHHESYLWYNILDALLLIKK